MVAGAIQIIGSVAGVLGGICVLVSTFLPEWKQSDSSDELLDSIIRHEGIWVKCVTYSTGQWQCEDHGTFFIGLPSMIQTARGLSCSAIVLGFLAFLTSLIGMECTSCLGNDPKTKARVAMTSGGMWICSGICIGVAVSYYAQQVLYKYNRNSLLSTDSLGQKYVYGSSLFVGWAAMVICVIGGLCLVSGSRYQGGSTDNDALYKPAYRPGKRTIQTICNTEYV